MHRSLSTPLAALAAMVIAFPAAQAATSDTDPLHQRTGFDNGLSAGWLYQRHVPGIMWVNKFLGQDAPAIHHVQAYATGSMMFQTRASWLAPLKSGQPVRIQLDTKSRVVNYLGSPTRRELVVELRDYDNPPKDHPYASVWTIVGYLDASPHRGWRTFSTTIADPTSATLPDGWGGYGAEDDQGRPYLPPDRTFADVLAGVDEIAITTYQPGYAYGAYHDFDVLYDNIEIGVVAP